MNSGRLSTPSPDPHRPAPASSRSSVSASASLVRTEPVPTPPITTAAHLDPWRGRWMSNSDFRPRCGLELVARVTIHRNLRSNLGLTNGVCPIIHMEKPGVIPTIPMTTVLATYIPETGDGRRNPHRSSWLSGRASGFVSYLALF